MKSSDAAAPEGDTQPPAAAAPKDDSQPEAGLPTASPEEETTATPGRSPRTRTSLRKGRSLRTRPRRRLPLRSPTRTSPRENSGPQRTPRPSRTTTRRRRRRKRTGGSRPPTGGRRRSRGRRRGEGQKERKKEKTDCRPLSKNKYLPRDPLLGPVTRFCEDADGHPQDENSGGTKYWSHILQCPR